MRSVNSQMGQGGATTRKESEKRVSLTEEHKKKGALHPHSRECSALTYARLSPTHACHPTPLPTFSPPTAQKKKMSVSEYIEKTELAAKVEAAVNEAVKARPDEPLSFLVSGE